MILAALSFVASCAAFICAFWLRRFSQRFPEERAIRPAALAMLCVAVSEFVRFVIGVL